MLVVTKGKALLTSAKSCSEVVQLCKSMSARRGSRGSPSTGRPGGRGARGTGGRGRPVHDAPWEFQESFEHSRDGNGRGRRMLSNRGWFSHEQQRYYRNAPRQLTGDRQMSQSTSQEHIRIPHILIPDLPKDTVKEELRREEDRLRTKFRSMRHWEYTQLGRQLRRKDKEIPENAVTFSVMSYNVLAQELLEQHSYLYNGVPREVLDWEERSWRILRDLRDSKADVLCLQEIQTNHFDSFYCPQLKRLGYRGIFKKRTGDKPDGCAIFYRTSKFRLHCHRAVDYYKPSVKILNRDNIGLVALLAPHNTNNKDQPLLCVANTHLLYNPKRHDVKLAQLQVLFAELDHIAHDGTQYHPVVLTGDFNLSPDSSIYRFISTGSLDYEGLFKSPELIPKKLNITDQCQHAHVLEKRQKNGSEENCAVTFASGALSHKLKLRSAYPHTLDRLRDTPREVTTHQNDWVTVDYIFYSATKQNEDGKPALSLLRRLGLLSGEEMESLGGIPSLAAPSDHVPLVASFLWQW